MHYKDNFQISFHMLTAPFEQKFVNRNSLEVNAGAYNRVSTGAREGVNVRKHDGVSAGARDRVSVGARYRVRAKELDKVRAIDLNGPKQWVTVSKKIAKNYCGATSLLGLF